MHINDQLEKLEKHSLRLLDITEYLISVKYPKAKNHKEEVAEFMETLDKCSSEVFTVLYERHAVAGAAVAPIATAAAAARPSSKPSFLKPDKLCHDSSTSVFRTWKKQFKAYFDASGLHNLPCLQQQAIFPTVRTIPSVLASIAKLRLPHPFSPPSSVFTPV